MKSRLLLLPVIGAVVVGALVGCSAPAPAPAESSAEPSTPNTQEPTPTNTPEAPVDNPEAQAQLIETAKADLQQFEGMSVAEIAALPDTEQARFVALTNVVNFPDYQSSWKRWAATQDQSVPNITKDSDPQDIMNYTTWQQRLMFSFTGDEREEYLQAMLYNGSDSFAYQTFKDFSNQYPDRWKGSAAAQNNIAPLVNVTDAHDLVDNGDGTATRMITFSGVNGNRTATLHYNEVSLSDGTVVSVWRVD